MADFSVGFEVTSDLTEVRLLSRIPARTRYSGLRIDHHTSFVDLPGDRQETKQHGCWITTWIGNQPRLLDLCPIPLRQSKDCLLHQIGARVVESIPDIVGRWIFEPEVRAKIDHPTPGLDQVGYDAMRFCVRITHEGHITLGQCFFVVQLVRPRYTHMREHFVYVLARVRPRSELVQFDLGVTRQDIR